MAVEPFPASFDDYTPTQWLTVSILADIHLAFALRV